MQNHKQQGESGKDLGFSGLKYFPELLGRTEQEALVIEIQALVAQSPLFQPMMPRTGKAFSVRMTNLGPMGWVSDKAGYRYQPQHPETGREWPAIPLSLLTIWERVSDYPLSPQCCLVNYYMGTAGMGLHRDNSEQNFEAPVVSISLGDTALFRLGGLNRRDSTLSFKLNSGDVLVLGGPSRLRFHGIDRIYPGSSRLLTKGGRINLTLRYVG